MIQFGLSRKLKPVHGIASKVTTLKMQISVFLSQNLKKAQRLQFWHNVDKNLQEGTVSTHRCVDAVPETGNVADVMP
jgi:hypothetical protein